MEDRIICLIPKINTKVLYRQMQNDRSTAVKNLHLVYLYIVRNMKAQESVSLHLSYSQGRGWG